MSVLIGRAPGRLDVMGGIADYSGSLVLQWPIRESTEVRVQFLLSQHLHITSRDAARGDRTVDVPLTLINTARPPYVELRAWFAESATRHWAAYVAGVFAVLAAERGITFAHGANVDVSSEVPEGKGVSSSAALEAATMMALKAHAPSEGREQALLCQRAENLVVGAPCGVMDQMAVICGRRNHLMALKCQPAELLPPVRLPEGLAVFGIDSGIRHAVTGSDYTGVRVGAFMGYRILADLAGFKAEAGDREDLVVIDDPLWNGYLANVGSEVFQEFEAHIPNTLSGAAFLKRYGGTTDPVTRVDPDRCYAIWTPTAHPVYEHERVTEWAQLLNPTEPDETGPNPTHHVERARARRLGELMYQSHASYSKCGLGSDGTDLLVELAKAAGPEAGIYGAKITGGGSGGTVAVLAEANAAERVRRIAADYAEQTGRTPYFFEGSSDGSHLRAARVGGQADLTEPD